MIDYLTGVIGSPSMEDIVKNYTEFYKENGIRNATQLVNLKKRKVDGFTFPRSSILHYTIRGTGSFAISGNDPIIANMGDRVLLDVVSKYLSEPLGDPKPLVQQLRKDLVAHVRRNKRLVTMQQGSSLVSQPYILQVVSYQPLEHAYRYIEKLGSELHETLNYYNTVIENIKLRGTTDTHNHFIMVDVPSTIPARTRLEKAEKYWAIHADDPAVLNVENYRNFNTDERFILLQLWMWVGENRNLSLFGQLSDDVLNRINLLFAVDNQVTVLNLGLFNSWIKSEENPKGRFDPIKAKLVLLRFFMSLQQINTVSSDIEIIDDESLQDISDRESTGDSKSTDVASKLHKETEDDQTPNTDIKINATGFTKVPLKITAKSTPKVVDNDEKSKRVVSKKLDDTDDSELNEILGIDLDRDIDQLEIVEAQRQADEMDQLRDYVPYKAKEFSHTSIIEEKANELADKGLMSAAEVRRMKNLSERFNNLDSPFSNQSISDYMNIDPAELEITPNKSLLSKDIAEVMDKSFLNSSIKEFDSRYIDKFLGKHIVASIMHVQQAGIAVTDMKINREDTYLGSFNIISVQLTPVSGSPTTVQFKLPIPNKDGIMTANGVDYKLRKQRTDLPIRKIASDTVALTSNISKMFVRRSSRMTHSYDRWLIRQINLLSMSEESKVSDVVYESVFALEVEVPRTYSIIAKHLSRMNFGSAVMYFDVTKIEENFPEEILSHVDRKKYIPISYQVQKGKTMILVMDMESNLTIVYVETKEVVPVGSFHRFIGIDVDNVPMNYSAIKLRGVEIPLGVLLSYQIGFGNLLRTLGCKVTRVKRRSKFEVKETQYALRFEDEVLIFEKSDYVASLIMSGFSRVKNSIKSMSVYQLDKQDSHVRLFTVLGALPNHTRGYDLMFNIWVDPLTKTILEKIKEPTDLVLLMLSANDKLADDAYKNPNGIAGSYVRGYQRIPAMLTQELFNAVRSYSNNPMSKSAKVELNPNALWFTIIQDQTVTPIEVSNPIHSIKENSIVVYRGAGGRSAQSMTADHRQFDKDSIGIVSEANVDNGDVGTVTYLTADPNITTLMGINEPMEINDETPSAKVQSLAMAISPGSDRDDSKRVTFTSVMLTSGTFLSNATPNRLQTTAERTVSYRTDSKWVAIAKEAGRVTSINGDVMSVEYADGNSENIFIGKTFGTWGGATIPHQNTPNYLAGESFPKDAVLAFNTNYFQKDTIDPTQVVFKRSVTANVMFFDGRETLEDASSMSVNFANRLGTKVSHKRHVKIGHDHELVEQLVKVGDSVKPTSILCTIRPPISGSSSGYDVVAQGALDIIQQLRPEANNIGVVERIEVLYTGEIENMSPSFQDFVSRSDAALYRRNKSIGSPVKTAQIPASYRIDNVDVGPDQIVIRYYITESVGVGIGDKFVIGNQMKTIVSRILDKPYVTEANLEVDMCYGRQGISNRIVNSMDIIGTTNKVIELIESSMIKTFLANK